MANLNRRTIGKIILLTDLLIHSRSDSTAYGFSIEEAAGVLERFASVSDGPCDEMEQRLTMERQVSELRRRRIPLIFQLSCLNSCFFSQLHRFIAVQLRLLTLVEPQWDYFYMNRVTK